MTNFAARRIALPFASLVLSGCAQQDLVGEDRCYGVDTQCTTDVRTVDGIAMGEERRFDVKASRELIPSWSVDLECEECVVQMVDGAEGSLWTLVRDQGRNRLLQVSSQGELLKTHEAPPDGLLTLDAQQRPTLWSWSSTRGGRVVHIEPDGEQVVRPLRGAMLPGGRALIMPDALGGHLLGNFSPEAGYVERYDESGLLSWRQSNLRDARRFPFEDLGAGVSPAVFYTMLALPDGSVLLDVPKYLGDDAEEGDLFARRYGPTLLDPGGNLRWDVALGYANAFAGVPHRVLANRQGKVAYVYGSQDSLFVFAFDVLGDDPSPPSSVIWWGERVEYHAVNPIAACLDPAGRVYTVFRTGERDAPALMLCKIETAQPEAVPECASLRADVALPRAGLGALGGPDVDILCPAAGKIVLAIRTSRPTQPSFQKELAGVEF